MKETLSLVANAKINLYLDITGRRADSYHLLETVMQSVDLSDIVTVSLTGGGISAFCTNPDIPQNEKNICYKAAKLFFERTNSDRGAEIRIDKRIPDGAGLGGGSADAAAVLSALNTLSGLPLRAEELSELAASVGADVPFCLVGGTRVCKGIGDVVEPTNPLPKRFYLIVKPNFRCPTGEAYARYDAAPIPPRNRLEAFCNAGSRYHEEMYNVFEEIYADNQIFALKSALSGAGAIGSSLTGSGSAVFGVYEEKECAMYAARAFPEMFTAVAEPCGSGLVTI